MYLYRYIYIYKGKGLITKFIFFRGHLWNILRNSYLKKIINFKNYNCKNTINYNKLTEDRDPSVVGRALLVPARFKETGTNWSPSPPPWEKNRGIPIPNKSDPYGDWGFPSPLPPLISALLLRHFFIFSSSTDYPLSYRMDQSSCLRALSANEDDNEGRE